MSSNGQIKNMLTSYITTIQGEKFIVLDDGIDKQTIAYKPEFDFLFNEENGWEVDWKAPLPTACSFAAIAGLSAHQVHDELFPGINDLKLIDGLIELYGAFYDDYCDKAEESMIP